MGPAQKMCFAGSWRAELPDLLPTLAMAPAMGSQASGVQALPSGR